MEMFYKMFQKSHLQKIVDQYINFKGKSLYSLPLAFRVPLRGRSRVERRVLGEGPRRKDADEV